MSNRGTTGIQATPPADPPSDSRVLAATDSRAWLASQLTRLGLGARGAEAPGARSHDCGKVSGTRGLHKNTPLAS